MTKEAIIEAYKLGRELAEEDLNKLIKKANSTNYINEEIEKDFASENPDDNGVAAIMKFPMPKNTPDPYKKFQHKNPEFMPKNDDLVKNEYYQPSTSLKDVSPIGRAIKGGGKRRKVTDSYRDFIGKINQAQNAQLHSATYVDPPWPFRPQNPVSERME